MVGSFPACSGRAATGQEAAIAPPPRSVMKSRRLAGNLVGITSFMLTNSQDLNFASAVEDYFH